MKSALFVFVCLFLATGCGVFKDIEDTKKEVEKTNEGIGKTNNSVHEQTLLIALKELKARENTDFISEAGQLISPPVKMFPYAKTLADAATPLETIQIFHTLITEAQKGYSKEFKGDKRIRERMISLTAASAIAAFIPTDKLNVIISEQLDRGGEFEDTTYLLGLARYSFTKSYLLEPVLDPKRTVNVELLRVASIYFNNLKELVRSRYASKFIMSKAPETNPEANSTALEQLVVKDPELFDRYLKLKKRLADMVVVTNEDLESYNKVKEAYDKINDSDLYEDFTDEINPTQLKALAGAAKRKFIISKYEFLKSEEAQGLLRAFDL